MNRESAMSPQPFAPLPGVSVAFTLADLVELSKALDAMGKRASVMTPLSWTDQVVQLLVSGDPATVLAAAKVGLKNPDGTRFAGDVNAIDASAVDLGRCVADGIWRRTFGEALSAVDPVEGSADD